MYDAPNSFPAKISNNIAIVIQCLLIRLSQSYDEVTIHVTQSLPPTIGERSFMQARSSGTFSGPFVTTQDKVKMAHYCYGVYFLLTSKTL